MESSRVGSRREKGEGEKRGEGVDLAIWLDPRPLPFFLVSVVFVFIYSTSYMTKAVPLL